LIFINLALQKNLWIILYSLTPTIFQKEREPGLCHAANFSVTTGAVIIELALRKIPLSLWERVRVRAVK
jgi:hypothetical protein